MEEEKVETIKPKPKKVSHAERQKKLREDIKKNLERLDEEFTKELENTDKAMDDGKRIIIVEVCHNCIKHAYCTHHKEEKYNQFF